jgi:hypothetical protein
MKIAGVELDPLTKGIGSISESIRIIRDSVALLPDLLEKLEGIEEGVRFMADEVHKMRLGVDSLGGEVEGVRTAVAPLVPHMDRVAERVERLEPRLEDLSLALHPFRRAGSKFSRQRLANGLAEEVHLDATDQTESGENVSQAEGSPDS